MSHVLPLVPLAIAGVAFGVAVAAGTRGRNSERRAGVQAVATDAAVVSSVAAILAITLIPMGGPDEVELVPFGDIIEALTPPVDPSVLLGAASNILLFVPFGAALALRGSAIGKTALSGLVLSTAVEISQLLVISGRTASVDDLLLNTLGAVLGHLLLAPWMPARLHARRGSR